MREGIDMSNITADTLDIMVKEINQTDYISLTDIAKYRNPHEPKDVIKNWLRLRSTIEFLGLWERLNNPNFIGVEFDSFKNNAGSNSFTLSPQRWIESTNAIGIVSKSGRYGGTFAHTDIAFEFASWISPEFKLYIIKDYQRLKQEESIQQSIEWDVRRSISKVNYKIHTDAIKECLIPRQLTKQDTKYTYASEADILNLALFGTTAKEWRANNSDKKGNIRDYATIEQLIVLSNLENLNAEFIRQGLPQKDRLIALNKSARFHLQSLLQGSASLEHIKSLDIKKDNF